MPSVAAGLKRVLRPVLRPVERRLRPFAVLSYHRIAEPQRDPWQLAVAPATFAEQLDTFAEHATFVTLDVARRRRNRLVPGSRPRLAVTFDDGYVDNLTAALPILEAAGVPATVFVATGSIDRAGFWWDALDDALLAEDRPLEQVVEVGGRAGLLAGVVGGDRAEVQASIHASLADLAPLDVEPLVDQLLADLGAPPTTPGARPMTSAELVELGRHPLITIGVHTVHHVRLTRAGADLAAREIAQSTAFLDRLLGAASRPFAYPHGDHDATAIDVARRSGCMCAVTTDQRWVRPTDDPMALPRLTVVDEGGAAMWRRLESVRQR